MIAITWLNFKLLKVKPQITTEADLIIRVSLTVFSKGDFIETLVSLVQE
jgi:hypothetical protein